MPLHPALVHLPLALAALMPFLTAGLLLALWRNWLPRSAWVIAIAAQVALVAGGFVAMRTGEGDAHRVERIVGEQVIERHEEAAEVFVWGSAATLVLMLAPLLLRRPRGALLAASAAVVCNAAVLGLAWRVGHSGGDLVYGHGAAAAYVGTATTPADGALPSRRHDDDDDR